MAMSPLWAGLLGEGKEVLRQHVVDKAMADAEIIFLMNDLGAVSASLISDGSRGGVT